MLSKNQQKFISSLSLKKQREETGYYIVEGVKPVDELLGSMQQVAEIFATAPWPDAARQRLMDQKQVKYTEIAEDELRKISQLSTPNQVLAVVKIPAPEKFVPSPGYYLALDRVNDPGNLGTIIRICDWFGIRALICSAGTADCYNSKTVQASMGSLFRLPVLYSDLNEVTALFREQGTPVYAAVLEGIPLSETSFTGSGLIIMGSESHGISPGLINHANYKITIERKGAAESLNVAVAAGIICSRL
jgi:TrmH family RNA methyltransferase